MTWIQEDRLKKNDKMDLIKNLKNKSNIFKNKENLIQNYDFLMKPGEIIQYMREQKRINIPNKFDMN